jgi:SAM-dependent methyltransferase/uncharacterized protein YbaR (Trm112 family)
MKEHCLTDLVCPAFKEKAHCHGRLLLDERYRKQAEDDASEILEGIVRCQECGEEYPIICGILILVMDVKTYLAQNYSVILSSAAPYGVTRHMIAYLESKGYDFHDTGYKSSVWTNTLGMSNYICAHYDNLSSIIDPSHPLRGLIQAYSQHDFYAQMLEMAASALGQNAKALDIGCNVGGMTYRLAPSCAFVYGVDISFRAALIARRILLNRPERLNSYRFYHKGLSFEERMLSIEQRRNVEIIVASGLNLPFADGFFDLVSCANVLDLVSQPSGLLRESLRVLKSGGKLLLADPYYWSPEWTPIENWIGVEGRDITAEALRRQLAQVCDIISRRDRVLWLLRVYDRYFTIWLNDCILAQKR